MECATEKHRYGEKGVEPCRKKKVRKDTRGCSKKEAHSRTNRREREKTGLKKTRKQTATSGLIDVGIQQENSTKTQEVEPPLWSGGSSVEGCK